MITKYVSFKNEHGHDLYGVLRIPDEAKKHPTIIVCPGFLQHKDHFLINDLANSLSHYGFATLRFDFRFHPGESHGEPKELTLTHQIKDIQNVIAHLKNIEQVDNKKMVLLGHDLGGVACMLTDKGLIDGLVLLNVRTDLEAFMRSYITDFDLDEWMRLGFLDIQGYELHRTFYEDLIKHDVIGAVKGIPTPILVVQSTNDKRVPIFDAKRLLIHAPNARVHEIVGGDHNLDQVEHRQECVQVVSDWVKEIL